MCTHEQEDACLTNALIDAHGDDPEFGCASFRPDEHVGHTGGDGRVWRLRSGQQLWSTTARKGANRPWSRP